jgi:hypothetical protein
MGGEFRGIHALNGGDAITEITGMGHKQWVFENISAFAQVAEKEIGAGIPGAFVISQSTLVFIVA